MNPPEPISTFHSLPLLEDYVRHGLWPEQPELLFTYIELADECGEWNTHRRVFEVMFSTIQDYDVDLHWRCLCLDYIYRPLRAMNKSAATRQQFAVSRACAWSVQQLVV